ncbi:hypothetical protein [Paenibacillus sp. FSL P4-0288]|uniref:hypothetical protein n=1 Tax=Paenibacillus sp. FSL P4-0288 TaxID=2921633 RepID=UPI0030F9F7FB
MNGQNPCQWVIELLQQKNESLDKNESEMIDTLEIIKGQHEKKKDNGLLDTHVKWLIEQAEKLQRIETTWREGSQEEMDDLLESTFHY